MGPPVAAVERLEDRVLLSAINGTVFSDHDGDAYRDTGERGLSGVTVFLDANDNGTLDAGELTTVTDAGGSWQFTGLEAGEYVVRPVVPEGFQHVENTIGSFYSIDVTNGQLVRLDGGHVTKTDLIPPDGFNAPPALHGLALTNDGELYALQANLSIDRLWKIDPTNGELTLIGSTGQNHAWGMGYDPATDTIYGVAYMSGRVRLGTIDRTSGAFTAIETGIGAPSSGGTDALTGTGGIDIDTVNRRIIAYDFHDGEVYSFDFDGSAVKLSQTDARLSGSLAFDGERFVMESRDAASLIALDPDAGTWSTIVEHGSLFFEEALEYIPGSKVDGRVTVGADETITAGDFALVPSAASIHGTVWDDADADGVPDEGEAGMGGVTVYLDLNKNGVLDSASGETVTVDPAQYETGTVLSDIASGMTLTALTSDGEPFETVKAYSGYLAHEEFGGEGYLWGGYNPLLRIDFDTPVDSFSIDARGYVRNIHAWLRAYDVNGNLLTEYYSDALPNSMTTHTVTADNIAYVIASAVGTQFPRIVFGKVSIPAGPSEPTTTTAADGSYSFENLAAGTYVVNQVSPTGYYQTTPVSDRNVYYGTAYVPGTNGEMKLVTVDAVTGQVTWVGEPLTQRIHGLVRTNDGALFGTTYQNDSLYSIDPTTGELQLIGDTGWEITGGLAYDPQTDTTYTLGKPTLEDTVNRLLSIDPATGAVTPIGDGIAGMTGTSGLAFDTENRRLIAIDNADGEFYEFLLDGTASLLSTGPNVRSYVLSQSADGFVLQPLATGNGFFRTVDPETASLGTQLNLSQAVLFESLDWNYAPGNIVQLDGANVASVEFGNNGSNTPPVVPPQTFTVDEGETLYDQIVATDVDGQPLIIQVVDDRGRQVLTMLGGGNFSYGPFLSDSNFNGTVTYMVRAYDGLAWSDEATITINVLPNDPPVLTTQPETTDEDVNLSGAIGTQDIDGDTVTIELVSGPSHGTLDLNPDGTYVYTPDENYNGDDSFVVRGFDGHEYSVATTQMITVLPVHDRPVAVPDSYVTTEDTSLMIKRVTGEYFDGRMISDPGDYVGQGETYSISKYFATISFSPDTSREHITLIWQHNTDSSNYWRFTFAAPNGEELAVGTYTGATRYPFNDADEPGLDVSGQHRGANTLTGEFTIWALTWAPDGSLDSIDVSFEQHSGGDEAALRGRIQYIANNENRSLLVNDTDPDGNGFIASLVTRPTNGTLSFNSAGEFTYIPDANFHGTDSFTYRVRDTRDSSLLSEPATVTIDVQPVNDPPVATDGTFTGSEDTALSGQLTGTDVDGDALTYVPEQLPSHGELTMNPDGTFDYVPDADYHGTDSFTYRVSDGTSESAPATVTLVLDSVNDAPTATGGTFSIRDNAAMGTVVGSVAASDVDGDGLSYQIVFGDPSGHFAVDADGVITVAQSGIDYRATPVVTLSVLVTDGNGGEATATVVVEVQPLPATIDVKPGDSSNSLNAKRDRNFSIAVLSTSDFDATLVDIGTLTFGARGDEASLAVKGNGGYKYNYRDVNGDGIVDLVIDFELDKTGLPPGTSTATLRGQLLDGTDFEAFDEVTLEGGSRRK